ncbi:hypothetical protein CEXT_69091 [Caerostris extrusa]|uniref:Uncharacterized protein n=1 Tax=Caerostris extrusa TaxID=172846 RepID=A0AAV4TRL1_CAEEX|nr:hypothetical protein CEXT_69091 [Caerostris extrusa]
MKFNRIRDLVSNLVIKNNLKYDLGPNCLKNLTELEDELLNEDVGSRNVRLTLHICGTAKKVISSNQRGSLQYEICNICCGSEIICYISYILHLPSKLLVRRVSTTGQISANETGVYTGIAFSVDSKSSHSPRKIS